MVNPIFRKMTKHIDSRNDIKRGDREGWAAWFDELEALNTFMEIALDEIDPRPQTDTMKEFNRLMGEQ